MLQVACFDTAFHRGHPEVADRYAIPEPLYEEGVRRYGFHGLSYEYISRRLGEIAPEIAKGRVVVAHLGSGASMCALVEGKSVESTMGFTALDGLPMGTRPGQLDAGIVLYLLSEKRMSAKAIERLLYNDCGLKGLSGISNDVRELLASADPRAKLALDYFVYRIALFTGMLAAAMGGIDGFVFTAGIGENAPAIREAVVRRLSWLGLELASQGERQGRANDLPQAVARRLLRHSNRRGADDRLAHTAGPARACFAPAQGEASMIDLSSLALLKGKKALVTGIANDQSIAWGCAKAFHAFGADLAITYRSEKTKRYVDPVAKKVDAGDLYAARCAEAGRAGGSIRRDQEKMGQARHRAALDRLRAKRGSARTRRRLLQGRISHGDGALMLVFHSAWPSWPSRS